MELYIITILGFILGFAIFIIINLLRKLEVLEAEVEYNDTIVDSVYTSMKNAYTRMKAIDRIGSFESDDESGYIFDEIKSSMEQLNDEYNLDGEA